MPRQQQVSLFSALRPTGVDPTAGARSSAISGLFEQVGDLAFQEGAKRREKEGRTAGAKAGLKKAEKGEKLEETKGSLFSIYDQSYDDAMQASYLAGVGNDVKAKLSQLASDHSTDTAAFSKLAGEYKKSVIENVEPETQLLLTQSLDESITNLSIKIRESEKQKNLIEADDEITLGVNGNTESALSFAFEGDYKSASDSLVKAKHLIGARLKSGAISKVEHDNQVKTLIDSVYIEANRYAFKGVLDKGGAIKFLQKVKDEKTKGKTPEQHRNLLNILHADMTNYYDLQDRQELKAKEAKDDYQLSNVEALWLGMSSGDTNLSKINTAIKLNAISFEQGKLLTNTYHSRGKGQDDPELILNINEMILEDPKKAKEIIRDNIGSSLLSDTAITLFTKANSIIEEEKGGGKSILNSSESKRFKKFLVDSVFDPGIGGFGTIENKKKVAKLELVFDERILGGERPADVARDLIDVDKFIGYNPSFGSTDNIDESARLLVEEYQRQQTSRANQRTLSEDEFKRQYNEIQEFKKYQTLINQFHKSYEAALNERD
jgi:hypothetical protein